MKAGKYQIKFMPERRKDKETGELITSNVPIFMQITFAGKRLWYYTNYRIDVDKWIDKTKDGERVVRIERVRNNVFNASRVSAADINRRIDKLRVVVREIFDHYENLQKYPTVTQLKEDIRIKLNEKLNQIETKEMSFFDYFEKYITDAEVSPLRKKQLRSTMNHLKRYNEKTTFENLDLDGFKKHLLKDKGKNEKHPKSLNTISGILKRLRAFLSYARDENRKWTSVNPFEHFHIDGEIYGTPIYLTKEERDILYNKKIPIQILDQVRDMFVLQCLIGARIADFVKLTKSNIVNGAIEYIPAKTAKEKPSPVRIPLGTKAWAIINKYNLPDGSLVPYIVDQRYNTYLKDLFRHCELERPVVRLNPLTRQTETLPLHKLASSHMARRTFIGLLHKTTKNEVIASMSGHVNDSKAFARYYKIDEDTQREAIKTIE